MVLQRLTANVLPSVPAGSERQSSRWQQVAADNKVDQQLDDHIWALMQTLTPLRRGTDAGVKGDSAPRGGGACGGTGTMTVSHACAVESGRLCNTDQQPGNSNPPPAAHALHHAAVAWGLPSPSPLGDESNMSYHPAPQNALMISQGHGWDIDTSSPLDDTVLNLAASCACPYKQIRARGAQEQLQALYHIDRLQRAAMERKMAKLSHPANLM